MSVAPTKKPGTTQLSILESGIAVIVLGSADERAVSLTHERLESFREHLVKLGVDRPKGLIITGPSADMFTVGADINGIKSIVDPNVGKQLAQKGQQVYNQLEALPFPTVAAISGPCVGGGCEMVLACKYRIISDQPSSIIGLPEIKLGILPGFGGTQRLPRLIGLPKALDIILAGKTLRPKQALKVGLVDEVIPHSAILKHAESIILGTAQKKSHTVPLSDRLMGTGVGRWLIQKQVSKQLAKQTKGFYPAPPAALEACLFGLKNGLMKGLDYEALELGRLAVTPESKSLVRVFLLTEQSKAIGKSARKALEHLHAIVVGAGVMGAGIAGSLARNGCSVLLKDTSEAALEKGFAQIKDYVSGIRYLDEQEKSFILNRIEKSTGDHASVGSAGIAIEAILEDLEIKKKVLSELARHMPEDGIVASNTSSLSISEIAKNIPHPERVVGMHFFNPVDKMPLVEIVLGQKTNDKTIAVVAALAVKLGKFPIVVKDVPGFLVNRILTPYLNEAAFLLEEGYSATDIDRAATSFGMPMGPVRLLDEVGLDVAAHVSKIMLQGYGDRMRAPDYAARLVAQDRKGKKNGAGFYHFASGKSVPNPSLRTQLGITAAEKTADKKHLQDRLILSLINEAVRCLDEGVAGVPGVEAANQLDLGTVMGMGFPPFRGGLLHYADSLGARTISDALEQLATTVGPRFKPCEGITRRAKNSLKFVA